MVSEALAKSQLTDESKRGGAGGHRSHEERRYNTEGYNGRKETEGERNGNLTLLTKFVRALLGKPALQSIAKKWDNKEDFNKYPARKLPAFRVIMMTIKRTHDLDQTLDLASS